MRTALLAPLDVQIEEPLQYSHTQAYGEAWEPDLSSRQRALCGVYAKFTP